MYCIEWVKRTFDQEPRVCTGKFTFSLIGSDQGKAVFQWNNWDGCCLFLETVPEESQKSNTQKYINEITKIFNNSIHETAETANFVTGEIQDFNVLF